MIRIFLIIAFCLLPACTTQSEPEREVVTVKTGYDWRGELDGWSGLFTLIAVEDVKSNFGTDQELHIRFVLRRYQISGPETERYSHTGKRNGIGYLISAIDLNSEASPYPLWVVPYPLVNLTRASGAIHGDLGDLMWSEETGGLVCVAGIGTPMQSILHITKLSIEFDPDQKTLFVESGAGELLQLVDRSESKAYSAVNFEPSNPGEATFTLSNDSSTSSQHVWPFPQSMVEVNGVAKSKRDRELIQEGVWPLLHTRAASDRELEAEE